MEICGKHSTVYSVCCCPVCGELDDLREQIKDLRERLTLMKEERDGIA